MKYRQCIVLVAAALLFTVAAFGQQKAEVTVSLNEAFFDSLLESVFHNFDAPNFPFASGSPGCNESITVLREMNGVRTAVRFRNGKVNAPLAFTGRYKPPIIGCMDVAGWAETSIDLEYDQELQRLVGRAKVLRVNLNGTGGIGGSVIARLIQGSIDKKLNPVEIIKLDKMAFAVPIRDAGNLRLKPVAVRSEVSNNLLNIAITYQFEKE
jgi:hypothetical protein